MTVPAMPLRLDLVHDSRLCYAMQQNSLPLVQLLRISNDGDTEQRDLTVTLALEPGLSAPFTARIAAIPAGATHNLAPVDLVLRPDALANAVERQLAMLRATVTTPPRPAGSPAEPVVVGSVESPVEVLAYNEWPGAESLPVLLAAFVLPNHPAIAPVLKRAAELLQQATQRPSLDGYQGKDPARARAIAAAIYDALQQRGLTYVNPPASFERQGQKVRTPEQVFADGMGTCLDLALLAAACLEQAGLHPIVVLSKGHAVAGAWLLDADFSEPATEDPLRLRKRLELDELVLFECTGLCVGQEASFDRALQLGARQVAPDADFLFAIDVAAARRARVMPLPVRTTNYEPAVADAGGPVRAAAVPAGPPDAVQGPTAADAGESAPVAAPAAPAPAAPPTEPEDRLARWQRRLLDLTWRNRLLHFAAGKKTIPLLGDDVVALADALLEGRSFTFAGRPELGGAADPRDPQRLEAQVGEDPKRAFLRDELRRSVLHADLDPEELDTRLVEIFRRARTALEENGQSTLYLAIGFLRLFETPTSTQPRHAPLLLLPLQLERASVVEGFRLQLGDDELQLNQTLVQKLATDFALQLPGVEELLADEERVDIGAALDACRRAIVGVDRWEVESRACIGFFSFTKHLMWRDLQERRADLLQNPLLRHLVETPAAAFEQPDDWPQERELDRRPPAELLCPKDADSSQLCAVLAAQAGRSFVLEGPPGTGKSQTITNLIAQCLADGKRVLFVAEKRAALAVVQRRLVEVGLGPFCLELHANKGGKKDVVDQLGAALDLGREQEPASWRQRAAELQAVRDRLNAHVELLHRAQPIGLSLFQVTAHLCEVASAPLVAGLSVPVDAADLQRRRDAVAALAATAAPLGVLRELPFHGARVADWTPALPRALEPLLGRFAAAWTDCQRAVTAVLADLGLLALDPGRTQLAQIVELTALLGGGVPPTAALTIGPDFAARRTAAQALLAAGRQRDEVWAKLSARWSKALLQCDVAALGAYVLRHAGDMAPLRWWRLRHVKAQLRPLTTGGLPAWSVVADDLKLAVLARTEQQRLEAGAADLRAWFGVALDPTPDWAGLAAKLATAERLRALAAALAPEPAQAAGLLQRWLDVAATAQDGGPVRDRLQTLAQHHAAALAVQRELAALLQLAVPVALGADDVRGACARAVAAADRWRAALPLLRDHCALQRDANAARACDLDPLVDALEAGDLAAAQLPQCFERSWCTAWLEATFAQDPQLQRFRGQDHERLIAQFRGLDRELIQLAGKVVRARLCAQLPELRQTQATSSELGVLLRERKKQRRHLPTRQLFARIPNLIGRLAPCLLMSPLSVAQFLSARFPPFDVVVFDEASQVPVWDAVGAIGRGRSLVVVGDSRQLPPTAFFQRLDGDEQAALDDDDIEELESVLDECSAAGLQRLYLRWHYRSRHEGLIAFSNHHYYENRLLTFPAAVRDGGGLGVRLVRVPGVYDRGRSQQNRIEAEALVAEVLARLRDPERSRHSLGIVTFSQPQQALIEDLLDQARREHPEIERAFGSGTLEPVFVKNLENVQGDERDVMLFSICYGPDAAGRVWVHFGPLNRLGGERRLNVAITRARRELLVFSSMRAEQIPLQRTQSLGARHLRAFLDYAERGTAAIAEAVTLDPARDVESPFERAVRDALVAKGWQVLPQVGCSGYRIDLGVVDPREPGRFLLGVECDGASYHAAATARDRDRLRAAVLQDLGWQLHRVWSTDWWLDPQGELARLELALQAALRRAPVVVAPVAPTEPAAGIAPPIANAAAAPTAAAALASSAEVAVDPTGPRPYQRAKLRGGGNPAAFPERKSDAQLRQQIHDVLVAEAPIVFDLLVERVAAAWQLPRRTDKVRARLLALLPDDVRRDGEMLWAPGQSADAFEGFRVPDEGDDETARAIDDLPIVEVHNAMLWLLRQHVGLSEEDLLREVARLFGTQRLGANVRAALERALELLVASGRSVRDGEQLRGTDRLRGDPRFRA